MVRAGSSRRRSSGRGGGRAHCIWLAADLAYSFVRNYFSLDFNRQICSGLGGWLAVVAVVVVVVAGDNGDRSVMHHPGWITF